MDVTKTGPGRWRLSGQSSYTGQLRVLDGTLVVGSAVNTDGGSPFGNTGSTAPVIGDSTAGLPAGVAALLAGGVDINRDFTVAPLGEGSLQTVAIGGTGPGRSVFSNTVTLNRSVTLQASTGGTAAFGSFFDVNASDVVLTIGSADNAGIVEALWTGTGTPLTAVDVVNGTARMMASDLIAAATPVTVGSALGEATLDLNGFSQTLSLGLSFAGNSGLIESGTLRLGGAIPVSVTGTGHRISALVALDADKTFATERASRLTMSNEISGSFGLTKTGLGILELSGTNDYTGATTVSEGTLLVAGVLGNTAVSVASGGRFGGTGSLAGSLSFAAGSVLDVADINVPLTVTGSTAFDSGFGIGSLAGIDWDLLLLDTAYTVLDTTQPFTSASIGDFGFANRVSVGSTGRQAYFESGSLQVIVVPEPGLLALAAVGLAAVAWTYRRRTRG